MFVFLIYLVVGVVVLAALGHPTDRRPGCTPPSDVDVLVDVIVWSVLVFIWPLAAARRARAMLRARTTRRTESA